MLCIDTFLLPIVFVVLPTFFLQSDHMEPLLEGLYGVRTPHSETSVALRKALCYLDECVEFPSK